MKIIHKLIEETKANATIRCPITGKMLPHPFEFIMILTGLKGFGPKHTTMMLNHMGIAKAVAPDLVSGYDLI